MGNTSKPLAIVTGASSGIGSSRDPRQAASLGWPNLAARRNNMDTTSLSPRESTVLHFVAWGYTNKEIAGQSNVVGPSRHRPCSV